MKSNSKVFSLLWKSCADPILFCKSAFPGQYLSCMDSGKSLPESLGVGDAGQERGLGLEVGVEEVT